MTNGFAAAPISGENLSENLGEQAISRLAERLTAMRPATGVLELDSPLAPRPSPAVAAALSRTAAMTAHAQDRARRAPRSLTDKFASACALVPYALVALALRLVMARAFFLDGQTRIVGPRFPIDVHGFDFSVVLPLGLNPESVSAFFTQHAMLPLPPVLAAYAVSYAEFLLPIMLVLGFGTRIAALGLLFVTAVLQVYVAPQALWSLHVYWASILMVLLALGSGPLSADAIFRFVSRR